MIRRRVFIVEDHPITRQGLRYLLSEQAGLEVCGDAEDARTALKAIRAIQPDLAIVDLRLKGGSGLELVKDLKVVQPRLPVLVVSMHDETFYAERALRAGAKGYVMKQEPAANILEAIRQILDGQVYVSETVTAQTVSNLGRKGSKAGSASLSDREVEVLELIGAGKPARRIASHLGLSHKTVQVHREHLKQKLGIKDAAALVRFAVQWVETGAGNRPRGKRPKSR
jgi:DNA-binding NarL/FixJ family response regulator